MISCEVKNRHGPEKYIKIYIMISSDIYHKGSVMLDDFQEKFG